MKFLKVALPIVAVMALILVAGPVAAQAPACPFNSVQLQNLWFTPDGSQGMPRCPEPTPWQGIWGHDRYPAPYLVKAGTNEDPFGGYPLGSVQGDSSADLTLNKSGTTSSRGPGIVEKFGVFGPQGQPFGYPQYWADYTRESRTDIRGAMLPGGEPSRRSGDGSSPRKAINISGAWADNSKDFRFPSLNDRARGETPFEIPSCWTGKIPAATSRWFKLEAYKNKTQQIWLDDELDTATVPSGSAVFGAADMYEVGTWSADIWNSNVYDQNTQTTSVINRFNTERYLGGSTEGFIMAVYDPDNLRPDFAWEPPNAAILVRSVSGAGTGSLSRGPGYGGGGVSLTTITGTSGGIHGYGLYNPNNPNHLLQFQGRFDGWVFVRVYNQMIWDGTATVCSYRQFLYGP